MQSQRESLEVDVLIVGAGPAGLSTAIHLANLAQKANKSINIAVLEKGSAIGSHVISGAVIETRALDELIPDWKNQHTPLNIPAQNDKFLFLTKTKAIRLPTPPTMNNKGNYVVSLSNLCKFLAKYAEGLGVQIFPGFSASEVLYDENQKVIGVITKDSGIGKDLKPKENFQPGIEIRAKVTVLSEGVRGNLSQTVIEKFNLAKDACPQTYGLGIKEIWKVKDEVYKPGEIIHTIGWPLDNDTYGGSFLYHFENNQVAIGYVVGLDYKNPYLSPFQKFQEFKTHPYIYKLLNGGTRISYGARAINEGGYQSIPKLSFPGGIIVGCSAGFVNVPKIKGTHTAMKSGILGAISIFSHLYANEELSSFDKLIKKSWIYKELKAVRNIRPSFKWGLKLGLIYSAVDNIIFKGHLPWTFKHNLDNKMLEPKAKFSKNEFKPDNQLTFDRLTSLKFANVNHEENQPSHLKILDKNISIKVNYEIFGGPEEYYCPANVYEYVKINDELQLKINAQNCLHCKACDIKDPNQNIKWTPPEGGGGPNYIDM